MQLSELFDEARADAPPARYDVEDAVRAGRRHRRRRQAGWGALAAVAVAAAIGVPQLTAGAADQSRRVAVPGTSPAARARATPGPAASVLGVPVPGVSASGASAPGASAPGGSAPAGPGPGSSAPAVAFTFRGYTAGPFEVQAPHSWRLADQGANIRKDGRQVGFLWMYRPGIANTFARIKGAQVAAADPVDGRTAYLATAPATGGAPRDIYLAWDQPDGGMAVMGSWQGRMTIRELRQVAEAYRPAVAYPVRIPLRVSDLPAGYRAVAITATAGAGVSLQLSSPAELREQMASAGRDPRPGPFPGLTVAITSPSEGPLCDCAKAVDGGRYVVEVRGAEPADARALLSTVEVADVDDPSTWYPISEALPASAQPPRV